MAERIAIVGPPADAVAATAAIVRARRAAGLPAAAWCSATAADPYAAAEFVFAEGALGRSDLALLEWASGQALTRAMPAGPAPLVVAGPLDGATRVLAAAEIRVRRDAFARPSLAAPVLRLAPAPPSPTPSGPVIALVGNEAHFRTIYPAVLLTLGEAAPAGALPRVVFVPDAAATGLPAAIDGVLLPGGASMAEVAGQIRAADEATARRLPLLGLCLGMQCMATAAMRRGGALQAEMEEVAGPGPMRSFVRHPAAAPPHRLGEHLIVPLPESQLLSAIGEAPWRVRMNHRYRLNHDLLDAMRQGGLAPAAWSADGICEAVEARDGTGWRIGIQGHPELGTSPASVRLFQRFLSAASAFSTVVSS